MSVADFGADDFDDGLDPRGYFALAGLDGPRALPRNPTMMQLAFLSGAPTGAPDPSGPAALDVGLLEGGPFSLAGPPGGLDEAAMRLAQDPLPNVVPGAPDQYKPPLDNNV